MCRQEHQVRQLVDYELDYEPNVTYAKLQCKIKLNSTCGISLRIRRQGL